MRKVFLFGILLVAMFSVTVGAVSVLNIIRNGEFL
jgi:hypothetical protein